ncbi:Ferredoxin [Chamberlinius hualienensis]
MPLRTRSSQYCTEYEDKPNRLSGEYEREPAKSEDDVVNVVYVDRDGDRFEIKGKIKDNVCALGQVKDISIEGACGGHLACVTCHVYIDEEYYDKLPTLLEAEEDMLTTATFLKENSRLSCQLELNKDMEGMKITLPSATKNFYVDGFIPRPH